MIDILDLLAKRTGLTFKYVDMPQDTLPGIYLEEHPDQVMAPFLMNGLISYGDTMQAMDTIVAGKMAMVKKTNWAIEMDKPFTIVLPGSMYGADERIHRMFPKADLTFCQSHADGLDMVENGNADMTLVNEISATYLLQSPYYSDLSVVSTDKIVEDITLATSSRTDDELISILNKGIALLDDQEIYQIVTGDTMAHIYKMSLPEWIHKNKEELLLAGVMTGGLVYLIHRGRKKKKKKTEAHQKERILEERRKADQEYQRKVFYRANFDALTGLYNKERFAEMASELLKKNPDVVYTFFRLNLEKFKVINEVYGYRTGDEILRKIADKLRESIGKEGVYGRMYADHFVICYPIKAEELKKRHRNSLLLLNCDGQEIRVQLNIGVYENADHSQDVSQAMDYAQIALQNKGKVAGSHYYYYREDYLNNMMRNQKITSEMEQALLEGQFQVFLQPQFEMNTDRLVGAEALVRWFHPEEGQIFPDEFIPVFEENRFVYRLDSYVCECVCRQMAEWKKNGKMIPVSVNLSRIDLQNPELITMLNRTVKKYGIPVYCLHLEITETAYAENQEELMDVIMQLREEGFLIEMDDFGSGYSSLNMLKDIPVDVLKLDMRFFSGETHMDRGGNIVETMVNLAHDLGILVIAEGVENLREANFLQTVQCRIAQGYLFGRPVPMEEFDHLLERCEIGEKYLKPGGKDGFSRLYWKIEKYNVLLSKEKALLFDYDAEGDEGAFTWMGSSGMLKEKKVAMFAKYLPGMSSVHPDCREALKKVLHSTSVNGEAVDFRSSYFSGGAYEWFHLESINYFSNGKVNRIIAVIRRMQPGESGAQQ